MRQKGKPKRWAVTSVKDTGEGIPSGDIPKIFLPFYTKKKHGTGIGLALSKKLSLTTRDSLRLRAMKEKGLRLIFIYHLSQTRREGE